MREKDYIPIPGHEFKFTRQWFLIRNRLAFIEHIMPRFAGKPTVYLEVGVYEGGSAVWMLQYVLTHPESRMIGIDTWLQTFKRTPEEMEQVRARAHHNLAPWMAQSVTVDGVEVPKCQLIQIMSADALRIMLHRKGRWGIQANTVDLCMIDGHHSDVAVLDDARQAIQLVRTGGQILFDDVRNDKEKEVDHVERGMRQWQTEVGDRVKPIWSSRYMEAFEKVK